ncbi:MAG: hypothetical protein KDC80_26745 [Saprospiraceae bacterium]|nr:hypothetical protein [Saprospiraceae bacterium]
MKFIKWIIAIPLYLFTPVVFGQTYYVATSGSDMTGDGSAQHPWASITYALDQVSDGSLILVKPGLYTGRVRMRGSFTAGVEVRSELPYQAQMRHNQPVFTFYEDARGCHGITLSGFDIAHSGSGAGALVVHIEGGGNGSVYDISVVNNVIHDSYNNDLLKINNSCHDIMVKGNMFYNQNGSDEHIDINSVNQVRVTENIFFNDFSGSGRTNANNTSSFIVIKDSNGSEDMYEGAQNINVDKNIFLNWEGSSGSNFILCGEDGQSFYEAVDVMIENNLLLGNSGNVMRAAFGSKGCKDIVFRNNTIAGDLPSLAYAFRLNTEGANLPNDNIRFYNNIWSDQTGSMGSSFGGANDFSDTPSGETSNWELDNNLYWNGSNPVPNDVSELINYTDDINRLVGDPLLPVTSGIIIPRWVAGMLQFADGSSSIKQVFNKLVADYAVPGPESVLKDAANVSNAPTEDILGNARTNPDIGALEISFSCASIEVNQWIGTTGDWHDSSSNWSLSRLPQACDTVIIPAGAVVQVSAGNLAQAYTLEVAANATLDVDEMAILEVKIP